MTTFTFISDTHGLHDSINPPMADILIHSGDCTRYVDLEELAELNKWFGKLPHKHKVLVPGNHDWVCPREPQQSRQICTNVHLLMNDTITIDGWKIYGSPWTPQFFNWAFMAERGPEMRMLWSKIPNDTDILVTHGPPHGRLDWGHYQNSSSGCEDLMARVKQVQPRLHVFGHMHADGGKAMEDRHTIYVNASVCNDRYEPTNEIVTLELDKNGVT